MTIGTTTSSNYQTTSRSSTSAFTKRKPNRHTPYSVQNTVIPKSYGQREKTSVGLRTAQQKSIPNHLGRSFHQQQSTTSLSSIPERKKTSTNQLATPPAGGTSPYRYLHPKTPKLIHDPNFGVVPTAQLVDKHTQEKIPVMLREIKPSQELWETLPRAERIKFRTEAANELQKVIDLQKQAGSLVVRTYDATMCRDKATGMPVCRMATAIPQGTNLAEAINAKENMMQNEQKLKIAENLAVSIENFHRKGIANLDLRPGKILITKDNQVQLTDLDSALSRKEAAETLPGPIEFYMPPECLYSEGRVSDVDDSYDYELGGCEKDELNKHYDPVKADVYTYATTMLQLFGNATDSISWESVYNQQNIEQSHQQILTLLESNQELNSRTKNVLRRALSINPSHRPDLSEIQQAFADQFRQAETSIEEITPQAPNSSRLQMVSKTDSVLARKRFNPLQADKKSQLQKQLQRIKERRNALPPLFVLKNRMTETTNKRKHSECNTDDNTPSIEQRPVKKARRQFQSVASEE